MPPSIHPSAHISASRIGDDVVIGPMATVCAGVVLEQGCVVEAGACIGAGAHLGARVHVGEGAVIAARVHVGVSARIEAGAVVSRQVPPYVIVQGPVAGIVGYAEAMVPLPARPVSNEPAVIQSSVRGVGLHVLREVRDMRGDLCAAEVGADLPFVVRRSFLVYNVPSAELRGEHAHRQCSQFLLAVKGSVHVMVDDGQQREEFILDRPNLGLHLPPMVWGTQYRYSSDAVLLVLASDPYDADDYVRDYAQFQALLRKKHVL